MAKSQAIVPQTHSNLPAIPDYMNVADDKSMDSIREYVRPPRIKMLQALSEQALVREFGLGSVVLLPQGMMLNEMPCDNKGNPIVEESQPFLFTPLFFFAEFVVWNPLELKGSVSAIRDRTFDPEHEIARIARSPGQRTQPYPEDHSKQIKYVEHMNFIVAVHGFDEPCVMSFARAEFKAGQKFAGLMNLRKCPMYGGVYAAYTGHRENQKGNWYGLDIANPPEGTSPWVDAETFAVYRELSEQFTDQHEKQLFRVDYDDENVVDVSSEPTEGTPAASM